MTLTKINSKIRKITKAEKESILQINKKMGTNALRVLGLAYKEFNKYKNSGVTIARAGWSMLRSDPPRCYGFGPVLSSADFA
jgi:magnesium-transporting ATPase (P-type)